MSPLLREHLITRSESPADLLNAAARLFGGAVTTSPLDGPTNGPHELRGITAHDFAVGYFASPLAIRVTSTQTRSPGSYFINIGIHGTLTASRNTLRTTLDETTAAVINPTDTQELRPQHSQQTHFLGLRIDATLINQEFTTLTGHPPASTVRFDFPLDLADPKGQTLQHLIHSLLQQLDSQDPLFQHPELQRSQLRCLTTALLLAQPHTHTDQLHNTPQPTHPHPLRTALAYIEANLTDHISLDAIATAAHCSPRTLSSAFRNQLGLSPMSYIRNQRLDRIREDILTTTDPIGTIAYRWGITHLGRFAAQYRDRFAELPSDTTTRR
ncbi:helix-turn-helix transcriptional regulator [Streptomyces alboflavus]|uniref:helix-turn-helix transcriptional regulator n=1 Tax=Streptomyces alboflavus TaxID=67267 RepID=UPI00369DE780